MKKLKVENKYQIDGRGEAWVIIGHTKETCPKIGDLIEDETSGERRKVIAIELFGHDRYSPAGLIVRRI